MQVAAVARAFWLTALMAGSAHAQLGEPTPPPLVPGEAGPEVPPPEEAVLVPTTVANPPLPPEPTPGSRLPRIAMGLLLGAGAGTIGGVAGGFIGGAALTPDALQPLGRAWAGAAAGFALLMPVGVLLAGHFFDGDGKWWATVLGDVAGLAVGALAVFLGGAETTPLLFALPLAGSVVGYEATSNASARVPMAITFGTQRGTSMVSVLGRF